MSQHSHLYNSRAWRKRRALQLRHEPLCRYCQRMGRVTEATVADHIEPHRGDLDKFNGPLQSLCKLCHDSVKAREEGIDGALGRAWKVGHDVTGAPIDPVSHWYDSESDSHSIV